MHKIRVADFPDGITVIAAGDSPNCPTCHGTKFIRVNRPYYIGTRFYGNIDEQMNCPDCHPVRCTVCEDSGIVRYDVPREHPQFGKLHPCPICPKGGEMWNKMQRAALRNAELPEVYKGLTFDTWDLISPQVRSGKELARAATELYAYASDQNFYVRLSAIYEMIGRAFEGDDDERNSLVLQGVVGTGKTGLAAAVVNHIIQNTYIRPLYARTRDLIGSVQARYGKEDAPSAEDVLEGIKKAELLVVDEMNLQNSTPDRRDILEEVMRYRHGNSLPTIITLNADRDQLEVEWGLRTATVVRAMAHWLVVEGLPIRNEGFAIRENPSR